MDADPLSARLWDLADALHAGRPVATQQETRLSDVDLGYAVQDRVWTLSGETLAGYKIGLTNHAAQDAMGSAGPIFGRLARSRIVLSPATISIPSGHIRIVEPEIIFEVGRDIDGRFGPIDAESVFNAMRSIRAGIELCDTRFDPQVEVNAAEIVADNGCADRLILGPPLDVHTVSDLGDISVRLRIGDQPVIEGNSARVLGNPIQAVLSLVWHLLSRGEALAAGSLVASGSCAGMVEVPFNIGIEADFGNNAVVAAKLVPAAQGEDII